MTVAEPGDAASFAARPTPSGRPWLRRLLSAASLLVLFALAFLSSRQYRDQARPAPPVEPVEAVKTPPTRSDNAGSLAELLERGDQALQQYRFAAALSLYAELQEARPAGSTFIDYRLGLCHESLGNLDRAMAAYRRAITTAPSPAWSFACHLAAARCLLQQGEAVHARQMLYPVLLDEDRQQTLPERFVADARYLAALAVGGEHSREPRPHDGPIRFIDFRVEIPFYFDELTESVESPPDAGDAMKLPLLKVQKGTDMQPTTVLKVVDPGPSPTDIVDRLASAGGLRVQWSDQARQKVRDRSLRLAAGDWSLPELLETIADHLDLLCRLDDDGVHFSSRAEADPRGRTQASRGLRQRALQAALRRYADHPLAPAAHLELGNELLADGNADAALAYERVVSRFPASPLVMLALFNRAILHVRAQEYPLARRTLLRVIDHGPGHDLALRAYLRLGQLSLAEEDVPQALVHLRRAQSLAPGSTHQPIAVLTLAAAHLQASEPAQARAVLTKQRSVLNQDPHRSIAGFLDVYANYRVAKENGPARREAADLLGTLEAAPSVEPLGFLGEWLVGQAFRDLGLVDEAERLLRRASASAQGPVGERITLMLAETLLKRNQPEQAALLYTKLAESATRHGASAHLELARLELNGKRFHACADRCRQLWSHPALADRSAVLPVWGAALEGLGEFARASQCYAGRPPE